MDMEQEDAMWKKIYENIQRQKSNVDKTDHEIKIQQLDGGFFEKFGSLLREQSVLAEEKEGQEKEEFKATAAEIIEESEEPQTLKTTDDEANERDESKEIEPDAPRDSDSEPEESDKGDYIAVGWNIDELYIEVLYEILHNVGCEVSCEIGQTALFSYVQEAFKMSNDKHTQLMTIAEEKEAPDILLNVEIIEAKELLPKDSNGLSDPFVTLYLAGNTTHRYNTSVKTGTLDPIWEEHFALPIAENAQEDTLCLEVWDFDPAETVREKMGKFLEVKGVKGLRKLMKEIAITATTGQHNNELIGKASIPLKAIPASGMTMWYSLDKKHRYQRRGVVKVRLAFSSEKNSQVAAQEHRYLLKILLLHELETSKVCAYWWCGNFSSQAEALITQHSAQSGLTVIDKALAQWAVYCAVHVDYQLSFTLFSKLLYKLIKPLQSSTICEEDVKMFWDSTKKLLPSCFSIIRKIRKKTSGDKNMMKQLLEVLRILAKLMLIEPPENTNLFPSNVYGWLTYKDDGPNWDIKATLSDAVIQGATDWYNHIIDNNGSSEEGTGEAKLQHMIKIIQLVRTDLQKAVELFDKTFQVEVDFQYARTLYMLYECKLADLIEPEVKLVCKSIKKLTIPGSSYRINPNVDPEEPLVMGTTLFELYLVLQRFVVLGSGLCPTSCDTLKIKNFHLWFHAGVTQWLEIAVFKAMQRIQKAVELDKLVPVDSSVKYSSSAVDTIGIFLQVKIFWQQLNWPDVEGSYTFVAKIIDDICRCCVFYADHMSNRVEGMGDTQDSYEKKFEVTSEWCLAINNIDYVRQALTPFAEDMGMVELIQKLSDLQGPIQAQRCKTTLHNVIENAIDTVKNKIVELLDTVAGKMAPAMTRLLVEGAEIFHQDSNSIDRVMLYLDNNLGTLHGELNEDNFNKILEIIWENLAKILNDLVQSNLEKRRPPSFFANLHETLKLMIRCFKQTDRSECDYLKNVERLLALNGMETTDLIHQVHLDRWREQQELTDAGHGHLTVKLLFEENNLKLEIMNARNLKPTDSNGSCDSFVRVHVLPEEKFNSALKPKTQAHSKNLFPLYDEQFTITLTPEQRGCEDGLVLFCVKDKDYFGMSNQYMAEAFVHFAEIPDFASEISSIAQVHLVLSRPSMTETEAIKALEHRQGDKLARDFIKKYKQKVSAK